MPPSVQCRPRWPEFAEQPAVERPRQEGVLAALSWTWDHVPKEATTQIYPADVEVLRQGVAPEDVLLVKDGLLKLGRTESDGREIIVGLRSRGWLLGSAASIVRQPSPVAAVTLTRCRLVRMPTRLFHDWLRRDPDASWQLHEMHSREVFEHATRLADLTVPSSKRLRRLFGDIVAGLDLEERRIEVHIRMPLRWLDVARLIGVTPQHLSRLLRQLEGDGSIRKGKGYVIVNRHVLSNASCMSGQGARP